MSVADRRNPFGRPASLIAGVVYLAIAVWAMRAVLPRFDEAFPEATGPRALWPAVYHADQKLLAWGITRNARTIISEPWRLFEAEQCYPTPRATAFGGHMFGEALLGLPGYLLTRDPVVSYNLVVLLSLWLAALAMYALVYHWTKSVPAAFVAGLLFAFHPWRVGNPEHPLVYGNLATPPALLFADRLFRHRRWRDAGGLALFVNLQMVESFYQFIALTLLGSVYGLYLVVHHARDLRALLSKLVVVAAISVFAAKLLMGPYLETRATWALPARITYLHFWNDFGPRGDAYPGSMALMLAGVALIDRWRHRSADDPRLPYLVTGLFVFFCVTWGLILPGKTPILLPTPTTLLVRIIPGLNAVRSYRSASWAVHLVATFLAGFGVWAVTRERATATKVVVTLLLVVSVLLEEFHPGLATFSFGTSGALRPYDVRPDANLLHLYEKTPHAPLLDLPINGWRAADDLLWSAFHGRPVGTCFNAFPSPIALEVSEIAARLPTPGASDALYALGFRSLVLHTDNPDGRAYKESLGPLLVDGRLEEIVTAGPYVAYRLQSPVPVLANLEALAVGDYLEPTPPSSVPQDSRLEFVFRNRSSMVYRHPEPIEPTSLLVRWQRPGGALTVSGPIRVLLPLALGPGEATRRTIEVSVPNVRGDYDVALVPAGNPDLVISRRRFRVR